MKESKRSTKEEKVCKQQGDLFKSQAIAVLLAESGRSVKVSGQSS